MPIQRYYFGSFGTIRGLGPLYYTRQEAEDSVYDDSRVQRRNLGSSDRFAVLVEASTGLCWWPEEDVPAEHLMPVRHPNGSQVRYPIGMLKVLGPRELAGFG